MSDDDDDDFVIDISDIPEDCEIDALREFVSNILQLDDSSDDKYCKVGGTVEGYELHTLEECSECSSDAADSLEMQFVREQEKGFVPILVGSDLHPNDDSQSLSPNKDEWSHITIVEDEEKYSANEDTDGHEIVIVSSSDDWDRSPVIPKAITRTRKSSRRTKEAQELQKYVEVVERRKSMAMEGDCSRNDLPSKLLTGTHPLQPGRLSIFHNKSIVTSVVRRKQRIADAPPNSNSINNHDDVIKGDTGVLKFNSSVDHADHAELMHEHFSMQPEYTAEVTVEVDSFPGTEPPCRDRDYVGVYQINSIVGPTEAADLKVTPSKPTAHRKSSASPRAGTSVVAAVSPFKKSSVVDAPTFKQVQRPSVLLSKPPPQDSSAGSKAVRNRKKSKAVVGGIATETVPANRRPSSATRSSRLRPGCNSGHGNSQSEDDSQKCCLKSSHPSTGPPLMQDCAPDEDPDMCLRVRFNVAFSSVAEGSFVKQPAKINADEVTSWIRDFDSETSSLSPSLEDAEPSHAQHAKFLKPSEMIAQESNLDDENEDEHEEEEDQDLHYNMLPSSQKLVSPFFRAGSNCSGSGGRKVASIRDSIIAGARLSVFSPRKGVV